MSLSRKRRKEKEMPIRQLTSKAEISHAYIGKVGKNQARPTFDILVQIINALNVSLNEFLTETGYLDKNITLIELSKTHLVPIISLIRAGEWNSAHDPFPAGYADDWTPTEVKGDNFFALIVKGDSMEPEFREAEIILVNPDDEPVPGDFVIVKNSVSEEATFKQLKKYGDVLVLHPLNPKYLDIDLKDASKHRIIVKVVEKRKDVLNDLLGMRNSKAKKKEVKVLLMEKLKELLSSNINDQNVISKLTEQLIRGSLEGLEIMESFDSWLERFKYQLVWLDKSDYSRALIRALWLAPVFAGTDFGSSRQRDMGQVWTDTARGFLGEIAFAKFLKDRFMIESKIDTRRGELADFLPSDIAKVKLPNENWREPRLKISLKTTKFNGRWLDVPSAQFEHSDVFVLIKMGILRHHFLAFLKAISFLKDKLFIAGKNLGELDDNSARQLWDEIPEFDPIPAYIAGFVFKRDLNLPIHMLKAKLKGNKKKRIAITHGIGLFSSESVRNHSEIQKLDPNGNLPIEIEPIIDSLKGQHFLAHSGGLNFGEKSWLSLVKEL
ncbi:MAG: S24 family peptidase [Candidatus Methanomethyliaceae archaeon]